MRIKVIIVLAILSLLLVSCSEQNTSKNMNNEQNSLGNNSQISTKNENNVIQHIYDKDNNEIGFIERNGLITLVGNSIFGMNNSDNSTLEHIKKDYFLYNIDTKDNSLLGSITDLISESSADRVVIGDHLYTSVITGDMSDALSYTYKLLDFDLKSKTMNTLFEESNQFIYNHLEAMDDELLLLRRGNKGMKIEKYDIKRAEISTLKEYEFNESMHCGDTVRAICFENGIINVLRVSNEADNDVDLFLDKYNKNMKLISSVNISDIVSNDIEGANDERRQVVNEFFCKDDLLYYENRSIAWFLGKLNENRAESVIPFDYVSFHSALTADKLDKYRLFMAHQGNTDQYYIINMDSGEVVQGSLSQNIPKGFIASSMSQHNDKVLITMYAPNQNDPLQKEYRIYYYDIEDLI